MCAGRTRSDLTPHLPEAAPTLRRSNPQRIEQRIGRCHRYGQKHDVVVVNFINRKNAADQRVFELLSEKFQLFEGVFGASDEVGCFEMTGEGINQVSDPSGMFLSRGDAPVSGTCVTVTVEGKRPLIAEVQALVVKSSTPQPRRVTNGVDSARVAMLLAVLERRAGLRFPAGGGGGDLWQARRCGRRS